jgi:hypothetical protein
MPARSWNPSWVKTTGNGMRAVLLAGAFLACGTALAAPAARPAPLDFRQTQLLDKFLAGAPEPADLGNGGGATAQTLAFLGREDLVMRGGIFKHGRGQCTPLQKDGAPVDPVSYIAGKAADVRVTMLNEAHDMPQGRDFNGRIAAALRPEGYRLYGAETFGAGIGADSPAWPLLSDGFYAAEPVYGRLIRSLRALRYRLFAYEAFVPTDPGLSQVDQINRREAEQAANLAAHVRAAGGDKVLVHVGYGHLNKNAAGPGAPLKMMAARFREDTGIDPLTVDQTMFWSQSGNAVICDSAALHFSDPTVIFVGAPKPAFTRGRPDWRLAAGDRFADIPAGLRRPGEAAIYEVRLESEPDGAVPVDRLLVRTGEDLPLLLPPGRYRLAVWTTKARWSAAIPFSVEGKS